MRCGVGVLGRETPELRPGYMGDMGRVDGVEETQGIGVRWGWGSFGSGRTEQERCVGGLVGGPRRGKGCK